MKKSVIIIGILFCGVLFAACGAGEKKIVHCDRCNAEIKVEADSNVTEDWTIYCDDCDKELGITEKQMEIINGK